MFKLAIEDTIKIPVKFTIQSDGATKSFFFHLKCKRLTQEEVQKRLKDEEELVADFLRDVTSGWTNQNLVLGEDGEPVAFSAEAFDAMLSVPGIPAVCFKSYLAECGAKAKN